MIAHGSQGYLLVPTGVGGKILRPMPIDVFARYVSARLSRFFNTGTIKFISCFGATWGIIHPENAQILADITGRKVWAYTGVKGPRHSGDWQKFRPRRR